MNETNGIAAALSDDLTFDPDIDASGVTVQYQDGDVVLSGRVPSYPQYLEAAAVAGRAAGVTNVHNHLEVALPPGDRRDDPSLTATANDALTLGHSVPVGVQAKAKGGHIILIGAVRDGTERAAAEALVAGLTGVRSITNDIHLRPDAVPLPPYS